MKKFAAILLAVFACLFAFACTETGGGDDPGDNPGGNGGGKPDLAMAGGKDISAADKALGTAEQVIATQIGV